MIIVGVCQKVHLIYARLAWCMHTIFPVMFVIFSFFPLQIPIPILSFFPLFVPCIPFSFSVRVCYVDITFLIDRLIAYLHGY